jgi:cullin 3
VSDAVGKIFARTESSLSFEIIYRNAYNLVTYQHGQRLYDGLKDLVQVHLVGVAGAVAARAGGDGLLGELNARWKEFQKSMETIVTVMIYVDRAFVQDNRLMGLYDCGLLAFRQQVLAPARVADRVREELLAIVARERAEEAVDRPLLRSLLRMLVELGIGTLSVYTALFEEPLLRVSREFFRAEASGLLPSSTCPAYLRKTASRLAEEASRAEACMHASTGPKLAKLIEAEMVEAHVAQIVAIPGTGPAAMMANSQLADLALLYDLLARAPEGLPALTACLLAEAKEAGRVICTDEERLQNHSQLVQDLLALRAKFLAIVEGPFRGDRALYGALNSAFEHFINLGSDQPGGAVCAEALSVFLDESCLKRGQRDVSEGEIEALMDRVVGLFRFVHDKDVFERYYKQHLAKRLLNDKSASDDLERLMISKLKTECGHQYTSKLEGMFTDVKLSEEKNEAFQKHLNNIGKRLPLDLHVAVLTMGFWPTPGGVAGAAVVSQTAADAPEDASAAAAAAAGGAGASAAGIGAVAACRLPAVVLPCCQVFETFFHASHQGRRLTWQTNLGTADLRARFPLSAHELTVPTLAMCVLLHFNAADTLSYAQLEALTGMAPPDLKRTLQSLACAKVKVLTKEPKGKDVDPSDSFSFNKEFTSKTYKIKISNVSLSRAAGAAAGAGATEEERRAMSGKVDEDRKFVIEAAIVRILKARKTLPHAQLIAEVSAMLMRRFQPAPTAIKARLESLIEREYVGRDPADRQLYVYLS